MNQLKELEVKIICPQCKRKWSEDCEQGRAIELRGKCIVCIIEDGERFETEPYEFRKITND